MFTLGNLKEIFTGADNILCYACNSLIITVSVVVIQVLVMANSDKFRPLTLYVEKLKQDAEQGLQWNLIMAGNLILVVPILIIYCFGSKQIIKAFTYNGIIRQLWNSCRSSVRSGKRPPGWSRCGAFIRPSPTPAIPR